MLEFALGHASSKGRYLRKLSPKIGLGLGLGLGLGDLSSETISEDTYLSWMSECDFPEFLPVAQFFSGLLKFIGKYFIPRSRCGF